MRKKVFYTESAYILGLVALATGTAFMEAANFGMSMVVAPAYLVYLKLSAIYPFITFGMAEYMFQALLLALMVLVLRSFKGRYLLAFGTTLLYGVLLDASMRAVSLIQADGVGVQIVFYILGMFVCAAGVSLLFHTYIPPEVYELFVKEISGRFGFDIHKCKTCYDCISCMMAIIMSFLFFGFGHFEGVKLGTIICAVVNGTLIGQCSRMLEHHFVFKDRFVK